MPTLYLLRHAKSDSDAGAPDHERPLSARGAKAAALMGGHLERIGARPERVLCSSARRALETHAALAPAWTFDVERVVVSDRLYLASAAELLAVLHEQPPEVAGTLVIAHNPGIHELAAALAGEGDRDDCDRLRRKYPTAGLCELAFDGPWRALRPGVARLIRFDAPRRLESRSE